MRAPREDIDAPIEKIGRRRGQQLFDDATRFYLNMSGDEFIRRFDAGDFNDELDRSDMQHLMTLRRFAEQ